MEYAFSFYSESLDKDLEVVCEVESRSEDEYDFDILDVFDNDDNSHDLESLPTRERNYIWKEAEERAKDLSYEALQAYLEQAGDAAYERIREENWDV